MNAKQKALYERVVAAGGAMWIETVRTYQHGKKTASVGQGEATTMSSMVEAKGPFTHTPGGYRREVVLRVVKLERIQREFMDGDVWMESAERWYVETINPVNETENG